MMQIQMEMHTCSCGFQGVVRTVYIFYRGVDGVCTVGWVCPNCKEHVSSIQTVSRNIIQEGKAYKHQEDK